MAKTVGAKTNPLKNIFSVNTLNKYDFEENIDRYEFALIISFSWIKWRSSIYKKNKIKKQLGILNSSKIHNIVLELLNKNEIYQVLFTDIAEYIKIYNSLPCDKKSRDILKDMYIFSSSKKDKSNKKDKSSKDFVKSSKDFVLYIKNEIFTNICN